MGGGTGIAIYHIVVKKNTFLKRLPPFSYRSNQKFSDENFL